MIRLLLKKCLTENKNFKDKGTAGGRKQPFKYRLFRESFRHWGSGN